jgi:putative oxidoreductase
MQIGLLILRLVVGGLFFAHGAQKLFGWFGGHGIQATGGFLESLGYPRGRVMAGITGLSETGAGLLLIAGLATPLAGAMILGVMLNAVVSAKLMQGLFGGYELDVLYAAAAAALAFAGAGLYSLDHVIGQHVSWWTMQGWRFGAGAVVLALVSAIATLATRRPQVPAAAAALSGEEQRKAA